MRERRYTKKRIATAALAVIALGVLTGTGVSLAQYPAPPTAPSAPGTGAKASAVSISGTSIGDYAFQPATKRVKAGAQVKWSWQSNAPHNVTFAKLGKHSKTAQSGSFRLSFQTPGTYRYFCSIHGFKGKIVVH